MHLTSISLRIAPLLQRPDLTATVHSAFAEACNLVADDGTLFTLASERVGQGPFNAVVSHQEALATLSRDQQLRGDGRWLWLGTEWCVDARPARIWSPYVDYDQLAARPEVVKCNLARLRTMLTAASPPHSLGADPAAWPHNHERTRAAQVKIQAQAAGLTASLHQAYCQGDRQELHRSARELTGLGVGLTPAGDDWMAGWLIGLRVRDALALSPAGAPLPVDAAAETVRDAASGRTGALSQAILSAAADGALPEAWHHLLRALPEADPRALRHAFVVVLSHGATSGADTLAGFLAALV